MRRWVSTPYSPCRDASQRPCTEAASAPSTSAAIRPAAARSGVGTATRRQPAARSVSAAAARTARTSSVAGASGPRVGTATVQPSRPAASGCPVATASSRPQSAALRARKPAQSRLGASGITPSIGSMPCVGFSPVTPQHAAGSRTEPPVSEPSAANACRAATAAPLPLEEPPVTCAAFQGLGRAPRCALSPTGLSANSAMCSAPSVTAPAASSRAISVAVRAGRCPARMRLPHSIGAPARANMSLCASGTPCSGPKRLAGRAPPVAVARLVERPLRLDAHEPAGAGVGARDRVQAGLHEPLAGHRTRCDGCGGLGQRRVVAQAGQVGRGVRRGPRHRPRPVPGPPRRRRRGRRRRRRRGAADHSQVSRHANRSVIASALRPALRHYSAAARGVRKPSRYEMQRSTGSTSANFASMS